MTKEAVTPVVTEPIGERSTPTQQDSAASAASWKRISCIFALLLVLALGAIVAMAIYIAAEEDDNDTKVVTTAGTSPTTGNAASTLNRWIQIQPVSRQPSARLAHAATAVGDKMYIHGGLYGTTNASLNDLWVYTESTDSWEELATTGDVPSKRLHHSIVNVDSTHILLFGGFNVFNRDPSHTSYNDLYELNLQTLVWTRITTTGAAPGGRGAHEAFFVDGAMYVFGGFPLISPSGHHAEMWKFTYSSRTWTDLTPTNTTGYPGGRIGFSFTVQGNLAYMYGGGCEDGTDTEDNGQCNDNWSYNWVTNTFTRLHSANSPPARRASHSDVAIHGIIYLFGGVHIAGGVPTMYNDVHAYDPTSNKWVELHPNYDRPPMPPVTFGHSVVNIGDKMVIFGGRAGSPANAGSNQLWEYHTIPPV